MGFPIGLDVRPEVRRFLAALTNKPNVQCVEATVRQLLYLPHITPPFTKHGEPKVSGIKIILQTHIVLENSGPVASKLADVHFDLEVPHFGVVAARSYETRIMDAVVLAGQDWREDVEFQGFLAGVDELSATGLKCWLIVKPVGQGWCKTKVAKLPDVLRFLDS